MRNSRKFYANISSKGAKFARKQRIHQRDGGVCQYCNVKVRMRSATLDHIIPRANGGSDDDGNLCLSCHGCNNKKANLTAEQFARLDGTTQPS